MLRYYHSRGTITEMEGMVGVNSEVAATEGDRKETARTHMGVGIAAIMETILVEGIVRDPRAGATTQRYLAADTPRGETSMVHPPTVSGITEA
jgi:hypothetical protein